MKNIINNSNNIQVVDKVTVFNTLVSKFEESKNRNPLLLEVASLVAQDIDQELIKSNDVKCELDLDKLFASLTNRLN